MLLIILILFQIFKKKKMVKNKKIKKHVSNPYFLKLKKKFIKERKDYWKYQDEILNYKSTIVRNEFINRITFKSKKNEVVYEPPKFLPKVDVIHIERKYNLRKSY
jgi:hypothetical protein